jgi:hypothetical protein
MDRMVMHLAWLLARCQFERQLGRQPGAWRLGLGLGSWLLAGLAGGWWLGYQPLAGGLVGWFARGVMDGELQKHRSQIRSPCPVVHFDVALSKWGLSLFHSLLAGASQYFPLMHMNFASNSSIVRHFKQLQRTNF